MALQRGPGFGLQIFSNQHLGTNFPTFVFPTTVFAATRYMGLTELVSVQKLVHSHRTTNLFFGYCSVRGLAHGGCWLPHSLAHVASCRSLSVGINICFTPMISI